MKRVNVFVASLAGLVLVVSSQTHAATIIASAHGDFVAGTADGNTGPWSATGMGNWNYFASDTENPADVNSNLLALEWSTGNTRYQPDATGLSEPLVADGTTELTIHPGQNPPNWGVIRWTAGTGEGGLVNISGVYRKRNAGGGGVSGKIFLDGVFVTDTDVFLSGLDTVGESFDFDLTVSDGSVLDFVFGPNGSATGDSSGLNITITAVPEPSGLALLLCSGIGLLGYQLRRKHRSSWGRKEDRVKPNR